MKKLFSLVIVFVLVSFTVRADRPIEKHSVTPPTNLTPLMRMKLDKSKEILEGLAMEDFDKISVNARSLHLLSTESGWNVIQTPEYKSQSRDFQRAADLIAQAAEAKDINRAAMGYVALTVRCVECHSYMRKHRIELMKLELE